MKLFGRGGKESGETSRRGKRNEGPKARHLTLEALESRELLAVSAFGNAALVESSAAILSETRAAIDLGIRDADERAAATSAASDVDYFVQTAAWEAGECVAIDVASSDQDSNVKKQYWLTATAQSTYPMS